MASTGTNVLRYSALLVGVLYGFSHQFSLKKSGEAAQVQHEYDHKKQQIAEAKKAWERKNAPPTTGVISDPENPQFDLEKWINHAAEQKT